jgi:hypothetical protein
VPSHIKLRPSRKRQPLSQGPPKPSSNDLVVPSSGIRESSVLAVVPHDITHSDNGCLILWVGCHSGIQETPHSLASHVGQGPLPLNKLEIRAVLLADSLAAFKVVLTNSGVSAEIVQFLLSASWHFHNSPLSVSLELMGVMVPSAWSGPISVSVNKLLEYLFYLH